MAPPVKPAILMPVTELFPRVPMVEVSTFNPVMVLSLVVPTLVSMFNPVKAPVKLAVVLLIVESVQVVKLDVPSWLTAPFWSILNTVVPESEAVRMSPVLAWLTESAA